MGLRDKFGDDFDASFPGEDCLWGLKFADFELDLALLGSGYVRRAGDNKVKGFQIEAGKQVSLMKLHAILQLKAGSIGPGNFQGSDRDISSMNFSLPQFLG